MSKMRVYEVAKQLNMDQKTVVTLFQSMGIGEVRNHMSSVEPDVVERLKRQLERQKSPEVVEERMRSDGRVVKRRSRAVEGAPESIEVAAARPSSTAIASEPARASEPGMRSPEPSSRGVPIAPPSAPSSRGVAARESIPEPAKSEPSRRVPSSTGVATPPAPQMFEPEPRPSARTEVAPPAPPSRPHAAAEVPPPPPSAPKSAPVRAVEAAPIEAPAPMPVIEPPPRAPEARPVSAQPPPGPRRQEESPRAAASAAVTPQRPSEAPRPVKSGIEVWEGRPGVTVNQVRTTPQQRRTVYDTRANATGPRPQQGNYMRPGMNNRPGQHNRGPGGMNRNFRNVPSGPRGKPMVSTQEMSSHKKVIKIEEQVSLQQLAQRMSLKSTDVLLKLLSMGMTGVHINTTLDADTAKILAGEFGWAVEDVAVSETDAIAAAMEREDSGEEQLSRPPIVTVMGHVDHGKTSLLDRIRKATVAEGEAGGITQHIGAYRVETPRGTIAFLDTPGHEAFTAMRARGASVTDIVILVVAADDGVMPQTKEAINHAKAAKVPIIVAVNKIDKPGADPEKIRRELANLGLQPEDWGGDTIFQNVSAKTGEGIDNLLESVILQSEVLELKASPTNRASGTVIEALLDRGRGPVARVMIQDGTLRTGDVLLAGAAWGKVRALTDELGRVVHEAGPATPVEVLGLNEVPSAGDPVHAVKDTKQAEEIAETRRKKASKSLIPQDSRVSLEALATRLAEADQLELKLIIKGDVQGSVEAVAHALAKLSTPKVKVSVVNAAVGGITEGDVNLAVASKAIIAGFNVRPAGKAASLAESEGVEIRLYNIIYNAIDDIRSAMEGLLPATKIEKLLGKAEVREVFNITKVGKVAGCMVISGLIKRTAEARLVRDSVVVWTGKLSGLRRFKDDAKEVAEGFECGISLENYADAKQGDIIESFEIEEVKTKLS